jgi:peptide/nickel transport system ATP-binding protein
LSPAGDTLLSVEDLRVVFRDAEGRETVAVDDGRFRVARGATVGIVGESGSGKSVTALAIMGLLPRQGATATGRIAFDGLDLLTQPEAVLRDLRGDRIAMIFQEPMTSLNPSFRVGDQIVEAIRRHRGGTAAAARARALEMLRRVRIPAPERRIDDYPHRLSGGMRQRVMIAMALACNPKLLIADEPTTALDVTIQRQIIHLLRRLREETGAAVVMITHDLGVVAETCDEVVVMYAGQVVETAPVAAIFRAPQHPYTVGLLGALPRIDRRAERLAVIPGTVPAPSDVPSGCRFAPRCPFRVDRCAEPPPLVEVTPGQSSRCWRAPLESLAA